MRKILTSAAILLGTIAAEAVAHPGHDSSNGLTAGILHPLTGLDHLATLLLVGAWPIAARYRIWWTVPLIFLGGSTAGFLWALQGQALPGAEAMIVMLSIALGYLYLARTRPSMAVVASLIGSGAAAHGFAHGSEMSSEVGSLPFLVGLTGSTLLLQGLGAAISRAALHRRIQDTTA